MTNDEFINLSILKHGDKYLYIKSNYVNYKTPITVTCKIHGNFTVIPYNHYEKGSGCQECLKESKSISKEIFIKKVTELHGDRYDLSNIDYTSPSDFIIVYDKINKKYKRLKAVSIMYARSNNESKVYNKYTFDKVKKLSIEVHGDYYSYNKFKFKTLKDVSIVTCPVHGDFETSMERHIFRKYGCRKCGYSRNATRQSKNNEHFIKKSIEINGDLYTYNNVNYINNKLPVLVTCKLHGDFPVRPDNHISNNTGCPICKQSKGEKILHNIFTKYNLAFISQYCISKYKYDFLLKDYNILIEYDGILHFKAVEHFGGESHLKLTQYRDLMKNRLAKKYGYKLIRLKYLDINNLESVFLQKLSNFYRYLYKNKLLKKLSDLVRELEKDNIKEYFARDYRVYKVKQ